MSFFKKYYFSAAATAAALAFGLAGCIAAPPGFRGGEGSRQFSRGERDDDRRRNDRDRDSVLERASKRHSSRKRCSSENSCKNICDDIYDRRQDKQDCEALPLPQVEALKEVYEDLESPDYDKLIDIDRDDFDVLINISIKPFDKLIRKYNRQESRETLRWIASDSDIAEVFKKEDDEHSNIDKLFKKIHSDLFEALKSHIYSGKGFLSLAVDEGNEEAGELVHLLLESKGPSDCKDKIASENCFKKYCGLGASMDSDTARDLMDFDYFLGYLEDIISDDVNKENGWDQDIRDAKNANTLEADDLDEWWEELC